MITPDIRQAIVAMHEQGMALREISRTLKLSRNTIRRVLRESLPSTTTPSLSAAQQAALEWLPGIYRRCKGNAVRMTKPGNAGGRERWPSGRHLRSTGDV